MISRHLKGFWPVPMYVTESLPVVELEEGIIAIGYDSEEFEQHGLKVLTYLDVRPLRWLLWDYVSYSQITKLYDQVIAFKKEKEDGESRDSD